MTDETMPSERAREIARLLCGNLTAREIAGQEDAPQFEDSDAHVQSYWLALAAALSEQPVPAVGCSPAVANWFTRNADQRNRQAFINTDPSYFAMECASAIMSGRLSASPAPSADREGK